MIHKICKLHLTLDFLVFFIEIIGKRLENVNIIFNAAMVFVDGKTC